MSNNHSTQILSTPDDGENRDPASVNPFGSDDPGAPQPSKDDPGSSTSGGLPGDMLRLFDDKNSPSSPSAVGAGTTSPSSLQGGSDSPASAGFDLFGTSPDVIHITEDDQGSQESFLANAALASRPAVGAGEKNTLLVYHRRDDVHCEKLHEAGKDSDKRRVSILCTEGSGDCKACDWKLSAYLAVVVPCIQLSDLQPCYLDVSIPMPIDLKKLGNGNGKMHEYVRVFHRHGRVDGVMALTVSRGSGNFAPYVFEGRDIPEEDYRQLIPKDIEDAFLDYFRTHRRSIAEDLFPRIGIEEFLNSRAGQRHLVRLKLGLV